MYLLHRNTYLRARRSITTKPARIHTPHNAPLFRETHRRSLRVFIYIAIRSYLFLLSSFFFPTSPVCVSHSISLSFSFSVRLSYSLLPLGGGSALGRGGGRCFALTLIYYRFVVVVYECTLYLYKTVITPTPRNRCACVVV